MQGYNEVVGWMKRRYLNNSGQVSSKEVRAQLDQKKGQKVSDSSWLNFSKSLRTIHRLVLTKPQLTWSHPEWEKELQENEINEISEDDFSFADLFGAGNDDADENSEADANNEEEDVPISREEAMQRVQSSIAAQQQRMIDMFEIEEDDEKQAEIRE